MQNDTPLNFHKLLDKYFGQRLSFSIFFRIWLSIAIVVILASGLAFYQLQKTLKPAAQRVVEDTLVDISRMLAVTLSPAIQSGEIYNPLFTQQLKDVLATNSDTQLPSQKTGEEQSNGANEETIGANEENNAIPTWYDKKTQSQLHIYITDSHGVVMYDSKNISVGKDFSQWNDIYRTLQGKYGARSSRTDPNNPTTSVMYVAAPIRDDQKNLLGVVSVGKPVNTLAPYLTASENDLIRTLTSITALVLLVAALMAWWLRHSIQVVNRYTQTLAFQANHPPALLENSHLQKNPPHPNPMQKNAASPHFYLGKELNQLVATIDDMKQTIENKAYVTEYVHTLTHELKSPLTAIRASGELLAENLPLPDRQQFSHIVLQQSDKLQQLVEQLLLLAKIEQPTVKLTLEAVEITPLVQSCISHQQAWLQKKQLVPILLVAHSHTLQADKFWLQQALQNVIDNAIKFAQKFMLVAITQHNRKLAITVINDSPVLPEFVLQKAFDRYFSQPVETQIMNFHPQKGTGLGLTLVEQVMHRHHGQAILTQGVLQDFLQKIPEAKNTAGLLNNISFSPSQNCVQVTLLLPI